MAKNYTAESCFKMRFDEFFFAYAPRNYEGEMLHEKEGKKLKEISNMITEKDPEVMQKLCNYHDPFIGKSMIDNWVRDIDQNGDDAKSTLEDVEICDALFNEIC